MWMWGAMWLGGGQGDTMRNDSLPAVLMPGMQPAWNGIWLARCAGRRTPSYLPCAGWHCFRGLTPSCGSDCTGAPLLPLAYVLFNLAFNVSGERPGVCLPAFGHGGCMPSTPGAGQQISPARPALLTPCSAGAYSAGWKRGDEPDHVFDCATHHLCLYGAFHQGCPWDAAALGLGMVGQSGAA